MAVRYKTRNALSCALLSTVSAVLISACDQEPKSAAAPRGPTYSLRIVHSADTYQFVKDVADKFNASNQRLSDGTTVQLATSIFDDAAHLEKITSGEMQAQLWLASSSVLASMGRAKEAGEKSRLVDCQSIMKSPIGLAYRTEDKFLTERQGDSTLQRVLLAPTDGQSSVPSLLIGSPRYSALGPLSALTLSTGVAKASLGSLTETAALQPETRERTGSTIRSFYTSEGDVLAFLAKRSGGAPLFAMTTQQAVKLFKIYNPKAPLEWSALEDSAAVADYPLCTIETRNSQGVDGQALRLTRAFFTTQTTIDSFTSLGYEKPTPSEERNLAKVATVGAKLVDSDAAPLRPSVTTFVIDASIKMDRPTLETIRREIKAFADTTPGANRIALIPASTNPSIATPPSPKGADLDRAISRLTTSGGNAIRSGINTAFDLYSDISLQKYRRAIVVFTATDEPVTREAFLSLLNRADQFIGRRNVDLFVLGIGSSPVQFAALQQFTEGVGGTFKLTTTANLAATLMPLLRQLQ